MGRFSEKSIRLDNQFLVRESAKRQVKDSSSRSPLRFVERSQMRYFLTACVAMALMSSGLMADEPGTKKLTPKGQSLLGKLGLNELQPIEKKDVSRVRGTGGSAATRGYSFIAGMLMDGNSKSYVYGLDTNMGFANLQQCGIVGPIDPFHIQESSLGLQLEVENSFRGAIIGVAGGTATSYFR